MERHHETLPLAEKDRPGRCVWCQGPTTWAGVGRRPVYCGRSCRQRAYEVRAAAGAGLVARDVVYVERPAPRPAEPPARREPWPVLLAELTQGLDSGRIYDRDLPRLAEQIGALAAACQRRVRRRYGLN
jgi:hypothetical protein